MGQPTFTGISNVSKNDVDSVNSNNRTSVEQRISNVSMNGVDSVNSNNRTSVGQPTLTRISTFSKNGVDSESSNNTTAGAISKPQFDASLGINYCKSPLTPITGAEGKC